MQNFLVTTILNVLTDALILGIPMPLLWKLQVPFRKKLAVGLLSSGAFVIAAAITRAVFTFSANPSALTINVWGVRETIVGILTVNIPILRPIFSKSFWNGKAPILTKTPVTHNTSLDGYVSTEVHNDTYAAISPSNFDFSGEAVLITGASQGPGLAMAISLVKAGASQISTGPCSDPSSSSASIFDTASKAGRKRPTVLELNMDVSDPASIDGAASKIRSEFGRLEIVVNSAGILAGDGNIAFIPLLLKSQGKKTVVKVSSIGAHYISPTLSGYQLRLAEFATADYGDKGLLVYSIHPGSAATEMLLRQGPQYLELKKGKFNELS
ncbi:Oxidoreductase ucpA [Fusarium coicis]|nr:Oxidoreductase ucpA [Fusarium coicis]